MRVCPKLGVLKIEYLRRALQPGRGGDSAWIGESAARVSQDSAACTNWLCRAARLVETLQNGWDLLLFVENNLCDSVITE